LVGFEKNNSKVGVGRGCHKRKKRLWLKLAQMMLSHLSVTLTGREKDQMEVFYFNEKCHFLLLFEVVHFIV
jgi:hypothetical protein